MTEIQGDDKLELFRQEILKKAKAEKEQILAETERLKHDALDREENRLLEDLYRRMQAEITRIKTENTKAVSRETLALKKRLYAQREEYLTELLCEARARLQQFARTPEYEACLLRKVGEMARDYRFEGSVIKVRSADLPLADKVKAVYGDCRVVADDGAVPVGGAVLENRARGILLDLSFESALREERERLYRRAEFYLTEDGGARA